MDITAALEAITGPAPPQGLPVEPPRLHAQRRKDLLKARDRRRAILNPANADEIVAAFPEVGDELHAIIPGTFAFGDLIQRVVRRHGAPVRMDVSTLSLSEDNVHMLLGVLAAGPEVRMRLIFSHYFQQTNADIWRTVQIMLVPHPRCEVAVCRQHTKLILFDYGDRVWIVAGSANLRSSNCIEQLTVFADPELFAFYRSGFDWLIQECQVVDRRPHHPPLVPLT